MSIFSRLLNAVGFSIDAIQDKGKRKSIPSKLRSEDDELSVSDRGKLVTTSRDIFRNYAIASWMVRKHLDSVSSFELQVKSQNAALAAKAERLLKNRMMAGNCEVTGRHSLRRFIRLCELRRVLEGDMGVVRVKGGKVQGIEGDRIRSPIGGFTNLLYNNAPLLPSQWRHGVITDPYGKALKYSVCRRTGGSDFSPTNGFQFERLVDANNMYLFGYFDRFDQTRGFPPIAQSLNLLRDTYEGIDYCMAYLKVAQMFTLAITSKAGEGAGEHYPNSGSGEDGDLEAGDGTKYDVDFGGGPNKLELDPGEEAKFLTANVPAREAQEFLKLVISVALKALDLPTCFFDESNTNYSGSRQAWIQYDQSADEKREDIRALLNWITSWWLMLWDLEGEFAGADLSQLSINWIPRGIPWIDPLKEIQADIAAIDAGLMSRQESCKYRGRDWYEIIDELSDENEYAVTKKVQLGKLNPVPVIEVPETSKKVAA